MCLAMHAHYHALATQAVFSKYSFHFTYTLTLIHTVTTLVGMWLLSAVFGLFAAKPLPLKKVAPLAAAFVGEFVQSLAAALAGSRTCGHP